jgi:hypothetical protein
MSPESKSGLAFQVLLAEQLLAGARETEDRAWLLISLDGFGPAFAASEERKDAETTLALARKATGEDT